MLGGEDKARDGAETQPGGAAGRNTEEKHECWSWGWRAWSAVKGWAHIIGSLGELSALLPLRFQPHLSAQPALLCRRLRQPGYGPCRCRPLHPGPRALSTREHSFSSYTKLTWLLLGQQRLILQRWPSPQPRPSFLSAWDPVLPPHQRPSLTLPSGSSASSPRAWRHPCFPVSPTPLGPTSSSSLSGLP